MTRRSFFAAGLETAASWWRIHRRDGVTLGFTTHDRDLWFAGILHRAAPGMLPSAVRLTAGFEDDPGEVEGVLGHSDIVAEDLAAGLFDGARVESGIVDWETLDCALLYAGSIAAITGEAAGFRAQLVSAKAALAVDPVPLSGPSCRARFCGPECGLAAPAYRRRAAIAAVDVDRGSVTMALADCAPYRHGELRWIDGPQCGLADAHPRCRGRGAGARRAARCAAFARHAGPADAKGATARIATCAARFGNAANFQRRTVPAGQRHARAISGAAMIADAERFALEAQALVGTRLPPPRARHRAGHRLRRHGGSGAGAMRPAGALSARLPPAQSRHRPVARLRRGQWPDRGVRTDAARRRAADRPGPGQHHLLVALGGAGFVHAHAGLRRVVVELLDPIPAAQARWRLPDQPE